MPSTSIVAGDVTALLRDWSAGDRSAESTLISTVYGELERVAARLLRRERPDHTLSPPSLVHEAYLRLVDQRRVDWASRAHFYAIATTVMRRVLLDHARGKRRSKRGGDTVRVSLRLEVEPPVERAADLAALDDALRELAEADPRKAKMVELRFFGGLSVAETAAALGCSARTVAYDWRLAKAWLVRELT